MEGKTQREWWGGGESISSSITRSLFVLTVSIVNRHLGIHFRH